MVWIYYYTQCEQKRKYTEEGPIYYNKYYILIIKTSTDRQHDIMLSICKQKWIM